MKCNMGKTDRIVRAIIGLIVIVVGSSLSSWWGAIGILPVFGAATGWCGLNTVLGISTCRGTGTK